MRPQRTGHSGGPDRSHGTRPSHHRGAIESVVGPLDDADELAQTIVSLLQGAALRYHLENHIDGLDRRLTEIGNTITALVGVRIRTQTNAEETR
jgi:hypothetical protein